MLRLLSFVNKKSPSLLRVGAVIELDANQLPRSVLDISAVFGTDLNMLSLVEVEQQRQRESIFSEVNKILSTGNLPSKCVLKAEHVDLLAPIIPRRNVLCVGKNYKDHIAEINNVNKSSSSASTSTSTNVNKDGKDDTPKYAQFFTKAPQCVIGPGEFIESHSAITKWLDYEAELAVIIGKKGRDISPEHALDHVFGYAIANDITARDIQKKHTQFFKGKTLDSTCPLGPYIVPSFANNIINPSNLSIKLWVNGELRQNSNTSNMIFDVKEIIRQLSAGFTLYPGDVILTGTPSGVGYAMNPPRTLAYGDKIAIEIEHLGRLENTVG